MTDRQTFFASIRAAVAAQPVTEPTPPARDESVARIVGKGDDLVGRFVQAAELSGAYAHVLKSPADLPGVIAEICRLRGVKSAIAEDDAAVEPLIQAAQSAGVAVRRWSKDSNIDASFEADAGLTGAAFAVAETGSLVLASSARAGRMISLAPMVHIALVRVARIVPDLLDLFGPGGLGADAMPSGAVLVTGPSKTADIELKLVTGVHGPGFVHVVIL